MSDARSQLRESAWRVRQRRARRRMGRDPANAPWQHLGTSQDKYGRLKAWSRRLAREHQAGVLSADSMMMAKDLDCLAVEVWLLALLWQWRRGRDGLYDVTPGLSGYTLTDIERLKGMYAFCRELRYRVLYDSYSPKRTRRIWVPKAYGTGKRPIDVSEAWDWLLEKAAKVVVDDLLTVGLPDSCIAFRRGLGHLHALARALAYAEAGDRYHWLAVDVADAYAHVPHARLEDVLHTRIPCPYLVTNLMKFVDPVRRGERPTSRPKGLPQGSPLSPLFFNAYMARYFDEPWLRRYPQWPMLRYADDILILARTRREARRAHRELRRLLTSAGFRIKQSKTRRVNMRHGELQWLGHRIVGTDGKLTIDIPETHWEHLSDSISKRRGEENQQTIQEAVTAFFTYHGPAWKSQAIDLAVSRARHILADAGGNRPNGGEPQTEAQWRQAAERAQTRWEHTARREARRLTCSHTQPGACGQSAEQTAR